MSKEHEGKEIVVEVQFQGGTGGFNSKTLAQATALSMLADTRGEDQTVCEDIAAIDVMSHG